MQPLDDFGLQGLAVINRKTSLNKVGIDKPVEPGRRVGKTFSKAIKFILNNGNGNKNKADAQQNANNNGNNARKAAWKPLIGKPRGNRLK